VDILIPDIGDFRDVPVIEVHVAPGDIVAAEDPLVTLESDKAAMDIPAPAAGTIASVLVAVGDRVSAGHLIVDLRTSEAVEPAEPATPAPSDPVALPQSTEAAPAQSSERAPAQAAASAAAAPGEVTAEVLVLGAGPGGYSAAFRAADLGKTVVLVDRRPALGGVCLNVGCIPSKALLHAAKVIAETKEMSEHGVVFSAPAIDVGKLRAWKDGVVERLTGGLAGLARQRKVTTIRGYGRCFLRPLANHRRLPSKGETRLLIVTSSCFLSLLPGLDTRNSGCRLSG
jgi:dihydrolipoamide dehydrogenase